MKNQIGIRSILQKGLGKPKIRFRKNRIEKETRFDRVEIQSEKVKKRERDIHGRVKEKPPPLCDPPEKKQRKGRTTWFFLIQSGRKSIQKLGLLQEENLSKNNAKHNHRKEREREKRTSKSKEETDCPKLLFEDYREIEEKRGSGRRRCVLF
ncbi:hypothetical protein Tco_1063689 [Tanacetum coccineum]